MLKRSCPYYNLMMLSLGLQKETRVFNNVKMILLYILEVMFEHLMCYESFKFSAKLTYENAMNDKYGLA